MEKPILRKVTEQSKIVVRLGIKQAAQFRAARDKGVYFSISVDENDYLYVECIHPALSPPDNR